MTSEILGEISPFKYLSRAERISLFDTMNVRDYSDNETIVEQGHNDSEVFLLVDGQVSIIDPSRHPDAFIGRIGPGNYFGERSALFGDERRFNVVACGPCQCFVMSGDNFLSIIKESMPVAQALARNLRQKQSLFAKLESFHAALEEAKSQGVADLGAIVSGYKALSPALHPGVNRAEIDTGAWLYAIRRLPENLTKNYVMLLSRNLPLLLSRPDDIAEKVTTKARRRSIWELKTGKSLVQLRDGQTDFIDFMTNLCLHSVEARKLRKRIRSPHLMVEIAQALKEGGQAEESMLERLPVSADELEGLKKIWPDDLLSRIHDM
ncbi:MAG: cyclic nucleotide-binding domain-containing protein, partial [Planctomycetota bacterium]|nr:cyclic nucleotide-binding domain-containing protein [Planctomycetota bacterium]